MVKTDGGRESLDRHYNGHRPDELEADHMPSWSHSAQEGAVIPDETANLNSTPARLLSLQLAAAGYKCTVHEDPTTKVLNVQFADGARVSGSGDWLRRMLCDTTPESAKWREQHAIKRMSAPDFKMVGEDNRPDSDYDPKELEMGIKVEMEHTKHSVVAKKIAKDHLDEDKKYYTHMKEKNIA